MLTKYLLLILSAILLLRCAASPRENSYPRADITQFPGWSLLEQPTYYDRENLWDAINGAADIHLSYGFEKLTIYQYTRPALALTLEVYDQGSPINAFGIYLVERGDGIVPIHEGTLAYYVAPYDCIALSGRYYIKGRAMEGKLSNDLCGALATHIANSLPGRGGYPPEFERLPRAGRIKGSEGFTKTSYLGQRELSNCIHAKYREPSGREIQLFAIVTPTPEETQLRWKQLASKWQPVKIGNDRALVKQIPYRGNAYLINGAQTIYGLADIPSEDAVLFWLDELGLGR